MIGLLLVNLCFSLISLFVNTFLLAQIFVMTGESFVSLGLFSLFNFSFIFLFQVVGGILCKQLKPIFVTRLSTVLACLLLMLIFFVYEALIYHYIILGLLWGCITGLYYSAYQFLVSKNFKGEATLSYISLYISMISIIKIIFPATFGVVVYYGNFIMTSLIILIIGCFQFLATFLIKKESEPRKRLNMKGYFKAIKEAEHFKQGVELWLIICLTGFADTITTMTTAFVILTFNTHLNLGILTSVFAMMTALHSYLYKKAIRFRKYFYGGAVVLPLLSVAFLLWSVSLFSVALFMGLYLTTRSVIFMEEETTRLGATSYWGGEAFILESHLFYETALASGAFLSALMVVLISTFYVQWLVVLLLFAVVFSFSLHGTLLKAWQRVNVKS